MKALKQTLKWVGIVVGALVGVLLVWGAGVEPRLIDEVEHAAHVPGLPAAWEGRRIAVVADYQVGMWGANLGTMRRVTERLVEARPAAVLLAGDFVYKAGEDPAPEIARVVEILRPLAAAGIPTYAVLGNHDYSLNKKEDPRNAALAARVRESLEGIGVRVLHNEAVPLTLSPGEPPAEAAALHLVGVGSDWAGEAQVDAALGGIAADAPRIVFMHNPDSFRRIPAGAAPFAIAGHTHGGQVRLPGLPRWSWTELVVEGNATSDGWIEASYGRPGNRLYVNRGLGFSTVPVRINSVPEVTYFRLEAP